MNQEVTKTTTCCFFGHREITETEELKQQVYSIVENLILKEKVNTFLFGSKSRFNSLCHEQVTKLKDIYPHINESYKAYLLESYEDTYYPKKALGAGRAVYVERNRDMINKSHFCIVYYQEDCLPKKRTSGTCLALNYAMKQNKIIILLPQYCLDFPYKTQKKVEKPK